MRNGDHFDAAMANLELPFVDSVWSPKHISAEYYCRIPVQPIYKQYPVFAASHEPPGYLEWLQWQDPQILWDDEGMPVCSKDRQIGSRPSELVFDAHIFFDFAVTVGSFSCGMCHTRVMPDGTILKGAQATSRSNGQAESKC